MLQQEVDLWQDCLNMERRITCWEKNELKTEDKTILNLQKTTSGSASLSTRLGIRNNNLPPEINDFQIRDGYPFWPTECFFTVNAIYFVDSMLILSFLLSGRFEKVTVSFSTSKSILNSFSFLAVISDMFIKYGTTNLLVYSPLSGS
ncbi:unnamed protein product [Trichobilharzia regenti]|nr:unnamed protein product [Trichobilharzia regenti]